MQVKHEIKGKVIEHKTSSANLLLTNKIGGFAFIGQPLSKYKGIFISNQGEQYKIIEEIHSDELIKSITNKLWCVEQERETFTEKVFMPFGFNSLVYETTKETKISLMLDIRKAYDTREWGRHYEIEDHKNFTLIKFTKNTNAREDSDDGRQELEYYVVIRGNIKEQEHKKEWLKKEYPEDTARNDYPSHRYVFNALSLKTDKLIITFSESKPKAIKESKKILKKLRKLKSIQQKITEKLVPECKEEKDFAKACAINSLYLLEQEIEKKGKGIFAGLPWFFQYWTRDELISLNKASDKKLCLEALERIARSIGYEGKFPSISGQEGLASTDSNGWYFIRAMELLPKLGRKDSKDITNALEHILYLTIKYNVRNDLFYSESKETWMDTSYNDDGRRGYPIELQAMLCLMYKSMYNITKNIRYKIFETDLKFKLRKTFWNNKYLADRLDDFTIRPNIFIAAYFYPELLTKKEWTTCFKHILPKLWMKWGGITTIDKHNPNFCKQYTGKDNKSYHRGDSWYFLNNIAALVLKKINEREFKHYITKIEEACTKEILWQGTIGHHSEISSAENMTSSGCAAQAWSASTFIEMIEEE